MNVNFGFLAGTPLTRTADVNAYTAGDVVGSSVAAGGAVLTLPGSWDFSNREMRFTYSRLRINLAALPVGMAGFNLHLYKVTPPSNLADNAAYALAVADRASYIGFLALGTPVAYTNTLWVEATQNKQINMAGVTNGVLYAYLQTVGGYTPSASDVFDIELHGTFNV